MQQLTETIDYAQNNCRDLSKLGFTKFSTRYTRNFTEPESSYAVDCTVKLSKTERGYLLGLLSMKWPTNPLVLDYIPIESLQEILELVHKLYGINDHIAFYDVDETSKPTITLDECRKLKFQPEKISHLDFHSKKVVQPSRKIHVGYGHKKDYEPKSKLSFSYDGKEVETVNRFREMKRIRDTLQRGVIDNSKKENETPSWNAYLEVRTPIKQDLELITQIFDITVKSVKS